MAIIDGSDFSDDLLTGTTGDDTMHGLAGADTLDGDAGDDSLVGGAGNDQLLGGPGNDLLDDWQGADTLIGMDGDDTLIAWGAMYGQADADWLDAGPGNDTLRIVNTGVAHQIVGGPDADRFVLAAMNTASPPPGTLVVPHVLDLRLFEGDRIAIDPSALQAVQPGDLPGLVLRGQVPGDFVPGQLLPGAPSPFVQAFTASPGYGQTTLLIDSNRNGLVDTSDLLVTFEGNPYLAPDAFAPGSLVIAGDDGGNWLGDTPADDLMYGLGGDDNLYAGPGNDTLLGGDGADRLLGGPDNDELHGGSGFDQLLGGPGNDVLHAEDGGGDLDGEDGDDWLALDGGAGFMTLARGGGGSDTFRLFANSGPAVVTDFQPGAGGDRIDVALLLPPAYAATSNPFAPEQGYLRLVPAGYETVLEWDADGASQAQQGWQPVLRLPAVDALALLPANFTGAAGITSLDGGLPNHAPVVGSTLVAQAALEDQAFSFTVPDGAFVDIDAGDLLSWTGALAGDRPLPDWLHFDPVDHRFSGTPSQADVGSLMLTVRVTDPDGAWARQDFELRVQNTNDAPTGPGPLGSVVAAEDQAFSFFVPTAAFRDADPGDSVTVTLLPASGTWPAWLTYNPSTTTLWGTPGNADVGSVPLLVRATDLSGASVDAPFTVLVANVNDAPVAGNDSFTLNRSTPLTLDLLGNDSDIDAGDSISVASFTQPAVGSLNTQLQYTPLPNWNGVTSFSYTLVDQAGATSTALVTLTVLGSLVGTDAANTLTGTTGADSIDAKAGNDTIDGMGGNDFVNAGGGADRINGNTGDDTLLGGAGNDQIYGGSGHDTLVGGDGNDTLLGGTNTRADGYSDLFVFNTPLNAGSNRDIVYGFEASGNDRFGLDLRVFAALAGGPSSGVDAGELVLGTQALDANDHLVYDSRTGTLYYDADGSGPLAKVAFVQLSGVTGTLDAGDFTTVLPPGL